MFALGQLEVFRVVVNRDRVFAVILRLALRLICNQVNELFLLQAFFKIRVESILDLIIGAPIDMSCNLAPSRLVPQVELDNLSILLQGPLFLNNIWIQVMVPPFSALLSNSAW